MSFFKEKIGSGVKVEMILLGERALSLNAGMVKAAKSEVFMRLFMDLFLGLGVPQMAEYFFRFNVGDLLRKFNMALSRFFLALKLTVCCRTAKIIIGKDVKNNVKVLLDYLSREV